MKDFLLRVKEKFAQPQEEEEDYSTQGEEYVELGDGPSGKEERSKITVRPFVMDEFEDIKEILDVLREGSTIALVNIKPLKDKDLVELKRAISKLRKTCDAIDGDIAGFGEDYVVAAPYFAKIHRGSSVIREQVFFVFSIENSYTYGYFNVSLSAGITFFVKTFKYGSENCIVSATMAQSGT